MSDPNPFAAFPAAPPKPGEAAAPVAMPGPFQFEYLRAYNYIFENPNWVNTVLFWSLCILAAGFIPVLPYLLIIGHMFEIVESLYLTRGTRYPDFDFNRFSEYLGRSIWPFLVSIILMFPLLIILYGGMFAVFLAAAAAGAAGGEDFGPVLAIVVGLLGFVLLMALVMGVGLLLTPMMLRAGLQQDFGAAFDFGWAMDFVKKTWVELILAMLFIQFSGFVLQMVGLMALCIGVYPATAVMIMAHAFMLYQLYTLYLSRGGTPIPLKPQMPLAPAGYMPPPPGYPPPQY
jgi:hypothetical protein